MTHLRLRCSTVRQLSPRAHEFVVVAALFLCMCTALLVAVTLVCWCVLVCVCLQVGVLQGRHLLELCGVFTSGFYFLLSKAHYYKASGAQARRVLFVRCDRTRNRSDGINMGVHGGCSWRCGRGKEQRCVRYQVSCRWPAFSSHRRAWCPSVLFLVPLQGIRDPKWHHC